MWIIDNWNHLVRGKKLWVTIPWHSHPKHHPDFRTNGGWPVGQRSDYTMSLQDGSRIHVQEFDGEAGRHRLRVHRDAYDPEQGLGNLLLHGLVETPVGPILAAVGTIALIHAVRS